MKFLSPARDRSTLSPWLAATAFCWLGGSKLVAGIQLNLQSPDSIKAAASQVAWDMVHFYTGNHTGDVPGNLPQPYYWWEAGGMFGALLDYAYYTGDTTYNTITTQALLFQAGPKGDYMPENQTKTEGNDDQAFWGMAVMQAAEQKYPDPPPDKPQWLALAQAIFNLQADRWDTQYCNGGLRWQIFTFNNGYDYKNSISNGCFFNIASRLAVYTGNQTYADWAEKAFNWTQASGLMTQDYHFFDGAHTTLNCSDLNRVQWTYNAGVFLHGAANMYNLTNGSPLWEARLRGIWNATSIFFATNPPNVMMETACEGPNTCDTDNYSFKAYFSRWMAASTKLAPFMYDLVMPKLQASATAAAAQCSGGSSKTLCGMKWTQGAQWDGTTGVGQQMSALEVIQANLITQATAPLTNKTGGTSKGNPSAGTQGTDPHNPTGLTNPITGKDRAGAGILTTLALIGVVGGCWWMVA